MKKLLSLIMVICLSVSLFAGCGEEPTAEATKAPSASATVAPTEKTSTEAPTAAPTEEASTEPTEEPTEEPTTEPTEEPTEEPTAEPTAKAEDPEVDAVLYRFYDADKYMWTSDLFFAPDEGDGYGKIGEHPATGASCRFFYSEDEGNLGIEFLTYDPNFTINGGETSENFNLGDYPVFKIRLKNETVGTTFESFIKANASTAAEDNFQIDISAEDTEYKEYYFDFSTEMENSEEFISKRNPIKGIRFDVLSIADAAAFEEIQPSPFLYVEYFGFFKTLEDAQNWNPAHVASAATPDAA